MTHDVAEMLGHSMPFSTQYVVDQSGASIRQLNHWIKKGWLEPKEYGGSGTQREWSKKELDVANLMARMLRAGLDVKRAAKVARLIVDNPDPAKTKRFIRLGEGIWLVVEMT